MSKILSQDQSDFLKRVKTQKVFYDELTPDEDAILKFLLEKAYVHVNAIFFTKTPEILDKQSRIVRITPDGDQYLEWESQYYLSLAHMEEEIKSIQKIAEIAEENAKSSAEDAKESRKRANIANWIAFGSLVVSIFQWIF